LHKVLELDGNYWFAFQFLASGYIDKGLYLEAIDAGRKGMAAYPANTRNASFTACALSKLGRTDEARAIVNEMLKPAEGKYLPAYNIALAHNCANDLDQTIIWLQRGIDQRDPRMTFLQADPKWDNLRNNPRFQELIRRVGFPT
jgi:tetratricopeptide (TPR) repeat protein